jgi:hemerythrin-like domain-containing protein
VAKNGDSMKATEILRDEHALIERVLDSLEAGAGKLRAGEKVSAEFFLDAAEFIRGFADGTHHRKEEGVLFEALLQHGFSRDSGPVAVMLAEHELAREYTRGLAEAAERLRGDPGALDAVLANALAYVKLLREHILKENNILFRMADLAVPPEEHPGLDAGFERIERAEIGPAVHAKYRAVADKLAEAVK